MMLERDDQSGESGRDFRLNYSKETMSVLCTINPNIKRYKIKTNKIQTHEIQTHRRHK